MEETIFSALPLLLAVIIICSALISIVTMGIYFSWKKLIWKMQIWVKLKTCQIDDWFSHNRLSTDRFDRGSRTWIGFLNMGKLCLVFKEVSTQLNSDRTRSSFGIFEFPSNFFLMETIKSFDLKVKKQILSARLSFKKLKVILNVIKPLESHLSIYGSFSEILNNWTGNILIYIFQIISPVMFGGFGIILDFGLICYISDHFGKMLVTTIINWADWVEMALWMHRMKPGHNIFPWLVIYLICSTIYFMGKRTITTKLEAQKLDRTISWKSTKLLMLVTMMSSVRLSDLIMYFKNLVSLSTRRKPVEVWPLQLEYSDESLRHNKDEGGKHKSGVYAIVTWWKETAEGNLPCHHEYADEHQFQCNGATRGKSEKHPMAPQSSWTTGSLKHGSIIQTEHEWIGEDRETLLKGQHPPGRDHAGTTPKSGSNRARPTWRWFLQLAMLLWTAFLVDQILSRMYSRYCCEPMKLPWIASRIRILELSAGAIYSVLSATTSSRWKVTTLLWVPRLSLAIALHPLLWRVKRSLVQYTSSAVGTLLSNLIPDSASMGLDPLCHKEEHAALSPGVHTGTAEEDPRDDRMSDVRQLQSRPEVPIKSSHETILAQSVGELQISCTANQSGSVEVAESREDHRTAAPAEDFKMDPAAMQLQLLVMAKQMEMLSRELERMQRKASPDNKRMRSEVGSGNSGQREGDDNQVRGSSSNFHGVGLANESDNASELASCLAEPFATTSEEWQLVHPKHKRKQRSVDALNAEITQLITPGVAQNGHGSPSEVNFLAACGVLPQRRQEVVTLPVKATSKWGRRQWDPGRHWDPGIHQPINGYLVREAPKTGRLVYEALAPPDEDQALMGSPVEETIQLCLWARPYHKFGYPTGEHVWSRAVAIVPMRPQRLPKRAEAAPEVGQVKTVRTPRKRSNSTEHTQSAQRKQSDKKPMTHRHLTGTVGKGTGQGDTNTGQHEGVSDGYSRLAELSTTKTHGMLGDTNSHSDLNGTSHTNGLPRTISIHQRGVKENDMELDTRRQGIIHGIYNMGQYNSSHNEISSHSNNRDNSKISPIFTSDNIDNDTQLAVGMDKGRHNNISSDPYNTGKTMMINLPSIGLVLTIPRRNVQVILVDKIIVSVDIILIITS